MSSDDEAPRGRAPNTLGPVGGYVIENLQQLRELRRLSYRELAAKLEELGRPIPALGLSRIEKGTRRVDADDLVALALALDVNPSALLLPRTGRGDDEIELTTGRRASARDVWDWADGDAPLPSAGPVTVGEGAWSLSADATGQSARGWLARADFATHARPVWGPDSARVEGLAAMEANQPVPVEEQVEQPVVAAIVTSDRGVLVGRRNDGKPPWTFIAGEVEPGESPADAAIREVKEETTLRVRAGEVIGERVHPKTGRTMIYMAAAPTHGTEIFVGDEDELAEVRWVSLAEAVELMQPYGMFEPVHEHLARELAEG